MGERKRAERTRAVEPVSGARGRSLSTGDDNKSTAHFATHSTWDELRRASSFSGHLRLISSFAVNRILCVLLCGWLFAPRLAQGKGKPSGAARLELSQAPGAERCVDQQSLKRAVEARLQRHAFREDQAATLYVQIAIARNDAGWSASLTMHDGSGAFLGRRSLVTEAADCSALDDSLALVVALLVDSPPAPVLEAEAEAAAPVSATRPPKNEARALPSETVPIRLPRDTPAAREPWRLQLAATGVGAIGMLPGFAPGVELGFGAKAPRLPEFRLFAGWYAEREQRRPEGDAGARFHAAYLGLEVCPLEHQLGVTQWFACAGQALGRMQVSSFGFDENSTSNHLTYALLARGGVQLVLASHWAVRLGIRAELPLSRGVFTYGTPEGGQQGLFQASPVAAVLDLGLVVRL